MKPREQFLVALEQSRLDAFLVAGWLMQKGFAGVRILPATTTPCDAERFNHMDCGDIEIALRVEVKHWPDIDFQSLADVPYDEIIVDEAYKLTKFNPVTLYGAVILNASRTGCLFISNKTRESWIERPKFDRLEQQTRQFVMCPKSLVSFHKLT